MRTILRNELRWAIPAAALATLALVVVEMSYGVDRLWFFPEADYGGPALNFYLWVAGLIGFLATWADDILRTREYLRHRPVGVAALFWARHLAGLGVLASSMVLAPTLHLLGGRLFSPDAALIHGDRLGLFLAQGAPAFLFYGLGVFAGSLCRTLVGGLLLAAFAGLTVFAVVQVGLLTAPAPTTVGTAVAALLLTPVLLLAAQRGDRQGRDADRPWRDGTWLLAGAIVVVLGAAGATLGLSVWHASAAKALARSYPRVSWDGQQFVLRRWSPEDRRQHQVDREHQLGPVLPDSFVPLWRPEEGPWRALQLPGTEIATFPQRGRWSIEGLFRRIYLPQGKENLAGYLRSDGYLHLFRRAQFDGGGEDQPWHRPIGKGPENLPFSPDDRAVDAGIRMAIAEPGGKTLWILGRQAGLPAFVRLPFPDDDHFVAVAEDEERGAFYRLPAASQWVAPVVLRGQRRSYLVEEDHLRPLPPQAHSPLAASQPRPTVALEGPVSFTLTLTAPDGGVAFQHHYRPRTIREHFFALLARLPTVLRPPVVALASLAVSPAKAFAFSRFPLDVATILGERAALAGNALLALALAAVTLRRLRKLGTPRRRQLFWTGAVVLVGLPAFVCQRLVETNRAWQPLPQDSARPDAARTIILRAA
jgi:hypothetical protein